MGSVIPFYNIHDPYLKVLDARKNYRLANKPKRKI